jgi:hypothetical protein
MLLLRLRESVTDRSQKIENQQRFGAITIVKTVDQRLSRSPQILNWETRFKVHGGRGSFAIFARKTA